MTVVAFLLCLGLCTRLTRLLVDDAITAPIRDFFLIRSNPGGEMQVMITSDPFNARNSVTQQNYVPNKTRLRHRAAAFMSELLDCPWCTSVHVAFWILLTSQLTSQTDLNWFAFAGWWASIAWLTGVASTLVGVLHGLERVEAAAVDGE
jgi:hypothetical protein